LEHLDIAYAIQVLSKFLKSPEEAYWGAVKRVFLLPQGYMISLVDLWWYWREFSWIYGCRWECVMLQWGMLLLSMVLFPAVPNVKKL